MLINTGWNDPRVISWQPAKFAAAVQRQMQVKPVLLQVDYETGHGGSADKFDNFRKIAKSMAFILYHAGYQKQIKL
ncbi:MAG: prolyl oligopeptidase family serine peptidase [Saprospiraceae bacterium]|nr:prolyl oligopeptidase family serine peptidase [Candidatus Brachybacter algidus]